MVASNIQQVDSGLRTCAGMPVCTGAYVRAFTVPTNNDDDDDTKIKLGRSGLVRPRLGSSRGVDPCSRPLSSH